jgi:antitoxin PrlF
MSIATLTTKGQVTIPKDVRDRLELKPGDRLDFLVEEDGSVRVRKRSVDILDIVGIVKTRRRATVEEMKDAIARGWSGR